MQKDKSPSHYQGFLFFTSDKTNQARDSIREEMRNGYNLVQVRDMIRGKIIPLNVGKAGRNSLAGVNVGGHVRWSGWSLLILKIY